MTHPSIQDPSVELLFRRLSARGYFEVRPCEVAAYLTEHGVLLSGEGG